MEPKDDLGPCAACADCPGLKLGHAAARLLSTMYGERQDGWEGSVMSQQYRAMTELAHMLGWHPQAIGRHRTSGRQQNE